MSLRRTQLREAVLLDTALDRRETPRRQRKRRSLQPREGNENAQPPGKARPSSAGPQRPSSAGPYVFVSGVPIPRRRLEDVLCESRRMEKENIPEVLRRHTVRTPGGAKRLSSTEKESLIMEARQPAPAHHKDAAATQRGRACLHRLRRDELMLNGR